ncbi:MAG: tRNA epoxyqueuosine(34) reductase QueG [Anaerolineae bacterium]|nr:tRNA epoxyqueuosine(34) reductase QueG [Anaerolineae bacterium]
MTNWLERVKARGAELGFDLVGVTPAVPSPELDAYLRWIEAGYHAEMGYMARPDRVARRRDLQVILHGARALIVVGLGYHTLFPRDVLRDPSRGRISNYAWGVDYHDLMLPRLEALADWLRAETGRELACRAYVDTGAILERSHARQAGFGFTGKNTLLIHPRRGSYFFLGEIITTFEFPDYDTPYPPPDEGGVSCGGCTRCLTACPTDAFPAPRVLDAGRCISYLTIEHKGAISPALRPRMGNWVYGCDECQEVCPFNRFAPESRESAFAAGSLDRAVSADRAAPPLVDLLALTPQTFAQRFAGSPVLRIKRDRLVRNACIAAGNWRGAEALPLLETLLADDSLLVREHAAWALAQYP